MLDQNDLKILSELLEKQKNDILTEVRQGITQTKTDLQQEIAQTRVDLRTEIQQAKNEAIQESAHNTKVLLESLVTPRFNLLAEGQQMLVETLAPKERVDELEADVTVLKQVVRNLAMDVNNLKKAQ